MRFFLGINRSFIIGAFAFILFLGGASYNGVGSAEAIIGISIASLLAGVWRSSQPSFFFGGIISCAVTLTLLVILFGSTTSTSSAVILIPVIVMIIFVYAALFFLCGRIVTRLWLRITEHSSSKH